MSEPPSVIKTDSLMSARIPSPIPSMVSSDGPEQEQEGFEVKFSISGDASSVGTGGVGTAPLLQRINRSASTTVMAAAFSLDYDKPPNQALVFVKPHAHNAAVCDLVESSLREHIAGGCRIVLSCTVSGTRIGRKRLIDRHYQSIARYATELDVDKLTFDESKFEGAFQGETWSKVLADGRACNAVQALSKLGCGPDELEKAWRRAEADSRTTKLGPGLYIGLVESPTNDQTSLYVVNGFYMAMRGKYIGDDKSIRCYVVEFDERMCPWKDFRSKVIGATDPTKAAEGSLRHTIMKRYKELGLDIEPSTGNNAVHASASPLEGLAERCNWLSTTPSEDSFGRALLARGIPESLLLKWMDDPTITFPPSTVDGSRKTGSLFDDVEDMDSSSCMQRLVQIYDTELFSKEGEGACSCCAVS